MIKPNQQDFEAIEKKYGPLSANASAAEAAERYRLAQANKLIRRWEQGKLPLPSMREMDEVAKQKK